MANRRFIDFPIASTVGDNDIILIWQDGLNKQTTKATILTGISQDLASLTDVDLTGLTNGQILRYNSVTSKWENTDQGNLDLNDLNDVTIVSPSNGQVLVYNSSTSKWENSSGGYVPYVGAVTTVDLGAQTIQAGSFVKAGGTSAQFLKADGSVDSNAYGTGTVTSVGLTMPSAFNVANSPVTTAGTLAVTGAGTVAQYIRGDGSLADFPESSGGGSSVSYYLNGSVAQGTIGGIAYKELSKVPILGAGTDFTINDDGYIASFITDAGDPNLLEIPGGNWNFETYFSASSGGGSPTFYVELYKVNAGGTATLIASSSSAPELIAFGTNLTPYFSSLAVPTTTLALTDRLAVRYYVTHSGRTITMHTEGANLCQIITTFTTGLTALNGLTAQVQNFAVGTSGTDFAIASATATHTFNLPTASALNRGALSSADWTTFNNKQNALTNPVTGTGASGQVAYFTGTSAISSESNLFWDATNDRLGIGTAIPSEKLHVAGVGSVIALDTTGAVATNLISTVEDFKLSLRCLRGGSSEIKIGNNNLEFLTNTSLRMIMTSNGRLLIGTPPPTESTFTLDVNGTGRFSGNLTANSIIKSGGTSSQFLKADGSVDSTSYLPLGGGTMTGPITTPNGTFGIIVGDDSRLADRNVANTLFLEGVQNNDIGYINFSQTTGNALGAINGGDLTWRGNAVVTGSASAGQVAYWSSGSAITGETSLFWDATNNQLGIGTAIPATRLEVTSGNSGSTEVQRWSYNDGNPAYSLRLGQDVTTGLVKHVFDVVNNGTTYSNNLVLDRGYVGIGTSSPSQALEISRTAGNASYSSMVSGTVDLLVGVDAAGLPRIFTAGANAISIWTNSTEAMRITSSGNVGIGTESPEALSNNTTLQIDGTNHSFVRTGTSNYGGYFATIPTADVLVISNVRNPVTGTYSNTGKAASSIGLFSASSNGYIEFNTTATNNSGPSPRMTITSSGNVGIGTTSPSALLEVRKDGIDNHIGISGSITSNIGYLSFVSNNSPNRLLAVGGIDGIQFKTGAYNAATERMRITSSGNVGIGTTSPSSNSRLHVYRGGGSYDTIVADGDAGTNTGFAIYEGGSARYALYSNGAGGNDSFNIYNFGAAGNSFTIYTSGNVGINSSSDNGARLQVSGTATFSSSVTAGGAFYTGGAMGTSMSNIYNSANNIFYAQSSASAIQSAGTNSVTNGSIVITNTGGTGGYSIIGNAGPSSGYGLFIQSQDRTAAAYYPLLLQPNGGNVLIGTTTDDGSKLRVSGNSSFFGTSLINSSTRNILYLIGTVTDNNYSDAIRLSESSGQATGRQSISFVNDNVNYTKARIWTQVGSGYNATLFGIDVSDDGRNLDTRLAIRNGNVLIGTTTDVGAKLYVNGAIRTQPIGVGAITGNWKFGNEVSGTISENTSILVEIDGREFRINAREV